MSKRTMMILVVVGAMVSWSAAAWAATADTYYPFNGNADDESGHGRHGAVFGATLIPDRDGNPDKAYRFDGDDHIAVDDPPSVTAAATFMAWVRMEQGGLRVGGAVLVKGVHLTRQTYMIAVNESDLTPTVNVHVGGTEYVAAGSEALSFGEWTHIAGVYDGSGPGLTIYVNGESKGNQVVTGALEQNSADLYIGCDFGNSLSYWEGAIDEVRIYHEALSASEVLALALGMPVLVWSQQPTPTWGGYQSSAEAYPLSGGWTGVYRAADDFFTSASTQIDIVSWWGGSYNGSHGETDTIDQVEAFLLEFYDTDQDTGRIGNLRYQTVIPLEQTNPLRTGRELFGGSDVFQHTARLSAPFQVGPADRYWFSVAAYLKGPPMWTWFESVPYNNDSAVDYNVNGTWDDQPDSWNGKDLAFALGAETMPEPGMVHVPAGTFTTSTGVEVHLDEVPIGKYEVTNSLYCDFLNSGGNDDHYHKDATPETPEIIRSGNPGSYTYSVVQEYGPVRWVTWFDAVAYCDWLSEKEGLPIGSYHLPTEAQFEKAGSWDPDLQRLWKYAIQSDTIDCDRVNYNHCVGNATDVGSYHPWRSFYGCYDMSGNVIEWCQDWYGETYPTGSMNPTGAVTGTYRVLRSGGWSGLAPHCETGHRHVVGPSAVSEKQGFRVAMRAARNDLHVDDNAPSDPGPDDPLVSDPLEDGSPEHPFDTIQEAIDAASPGATVIVRDGTYTGDGNRDIDFGGRAVHLRSESGPDNCIIDVQGSQGEPHRGFYFHSGEDENSIVDGFTIANGWVDSPSDGLGGGILCLSSSPAIMNNTIKDNVAKFKGGGLYCDDSSPIITSNSITGNTGQYDGGGICAVNNSSPMIAQNTITGNRSLSLDGGGIICWYNASGTPAIIVNNIVAGNIAGDDGGGIECYNASPTIANNTIVANSAGDNGGGLNCHSSSPTITNCILWENGDDLYGYSATYSCIQDGDAGEGNISSDPLFADPENGDFHLKSQEGRWDPAGAVWAPDDVTSPCIDAGDPASDFSDEPEPNGGRINMGAYGNTPEASKSYQGPVADGSLIIEGPDQRGEEPALMGEGTFTVDVLAEGIAGFAAVQAVLEFADPLGADDSFRISVHDGNPEFGGQAIVYNEALFGSIFPVYVANVGRPFYRQTAGFMMLSGSADLPEKTWLMSITYDYSIDFGSVGTHTIAANELLTVLAGSGGGIPHDVVPGSVTFLKWPIPGDANFDCIINVIDMLVIRDKLNADVSSGDNWRANVNEDGAIDILDLIFVRNNLHDICASMASAPERE